MSDFDAGSNFAEFPPSSRLARGYLEGLGLVWSSVTVADIALGRCRDDDDGHNIVSAGALSPDITASGANGLDAGAEAADTIYHVWIIDDSTGNNAPAGLLSLSSTAPTVPSGYDKKRRVGAIRNNAGSDIERFTQTGSGRARRMHYAALVGDLRILTGGNAIVYTAIDLSSHIPDTAFHIVLIAKFENNGGAAGDQLNLRPTDHPVTSPVWQVRPGILLTVRAYAYLEMPRSRAAVSIEYLVTDALDSTTIEVAGYEEEL